MKLFCVKFLCELLCFGVLAAAAEHKPEAVVRKLYHQVVTRHPLGIPKEADKKAIWPFLSRGAIRRLETAQACEADYNRQHAGDSGKPEFGWLERGLFSGENEQALPAAAVVEQTEQEKDQSFLVYVRLTYSSAVPDPSFYWKVAARVILERGRWVVDDIIFFKEDSMDVRWRLSYPFPRCDGSHWVGGDAGAK